MASIQASIAPPVAGHWSELRQWNALGFYNGIRISLGLAFLLVAVFARLVVVGSDGRRLHEEVMLAARVVPPSGRSRRLELEQPRYSRIREAVEGALEPQSCWQAPEAERQLVVTRWSELEPLLAADVQARAVERLAAPHDYAVATPASTRLDYPDRLFLRLHDRMGFVKVADTVSIASDGDSSVVQLAAGRTHRARQPPGGQCGRRVQQLRARRAVPQRPPHRIPSPVGVTAPRRVGGAQRGALEAARDALAAFGGRADVMAQLAPVGPVYQAGTLSGNPLAMAAGLAALHELEEGGLVASSARLGERLLELTRLAPFRARLADRLSGGMKQKLALACTLVHEPRLVVLDEPNTGVEPVS